MPTSPTVYVVVDLSDQDTISVLRRSFPSKKEAKEHVSSLVPDSIHDLDRDIPQYAWDGDDLYDTDDGQITYMVRKVNT